MLRPFLSAFQFLLNMWLISFLFSFFVKATFLWATLICYQLHCVVLHGQMRLSKLSMHCFVWMTSLVLALLPLTTVSYGRQGLNSEVLWCSIRDNDRIAYILWNIENWAGFEPIIIMIMVYFMVRVRLKIASDPSQSSPRSNSYQIYRAMYLYPLLLFCTWTPLVGLSTLLYYLGYVAQIAQTSLACLSLCFGVSLSIIFFVKSPEARNRWFLLILPHYGRNCVIVEDFDESSYYNRDGSGKASSPESLNKSFSSAGPGIGHSSSTLRDSEFGLENPIHSNSSASLELRISRSDTTFRQPEFGLAFPMHSISSASL